ncbi:hypothetical protein KKH39_01595 [Patescibacteria group bacterium]|nr:hypothetical protein [Patescibacteria group bacterium]
MAINDSNISNILITLLDEAERLKKILRKESGDQIRSKSTREFIRTISLAWFEKYKNIFSPLCVDSELYTKINDDYLLINEWSHSATSKNKYLSLIKGLRGKLIKLQSETITNQKPKVENKNITSLENLVQDDYMQQIIYSRFDEIQNCINVAPLAATVMMGGLLEAFFLARINKLTDKSTIFKQKTTPIDPKTKKPRNLSEWTLSNFIDVSFSMGWVRKPAKDIGTTIMEYRNLIHPEKQLRLKIFLEPQDSQMFFVIFNELTKQIIKSVEAK